MALVGVNVAVKVPSVVFNVNPKSFAPWVIVNSFISLLGRCEAPILYTILYVF